MRRQRYQLDNLNSTPVASDASYETVKQSRLDGKHRPDPEGNLISSVIDRPHDDRRPDRSDHWPVIDLDLPHLYVPSRTEGHGHLYLMPNIPLTHAEYKELLTALRKARIIGEGNLHQFNIDGSTCARLPKDFEERRSFYEEKF
jgi:hypothetical protein